MKTLALLNIVLGKIVSLGFRDWRLLSGSASSLCNLGKLLSKNLFCQLSREHYNPNLPGLLQGLHETMHVKHLVCDWHTTGVQYVKTTIIIIHSLPTLMLP